MSGSPPPIPALATPHTFPRSVSFSPFLSNRIFAFLVGSVIGRSEEKNPVPSACVCVCAPCALRVCKKSSRRLPPLAEESRLPTPARSSSTNHLVAPSSVEASGQLAPAVCPSWRQPTARQSLARPKLGLPPPPRASLRRRRRWLQLCLFLMSSARPPRQPTSRPSPDLRLREKMTPPPLLMQTTPRQRLAAMEKRISSFWRASSSVSHADAGFRTPQATFRQLCSSGCTSQPSMLLTASSTANDHGPVANGESTAATPQQAPLGVNQNATLSNSSAADTQIANAGSASVVESQSQAVSNGAPVVVESRNRMPC